MSTTGELAVSTLTVKVPWPSRTVAGTIRLYGADSSSSWIVMFASSRLLLITAPLGWKSSTPNLSVRSTTVSFRTVTEMVRSVMPGLKYRVPLAAL